MQITNGLEARPARRSIRNVNLILKNPESFFVAFATKLANTKKAGQTADTGGSKMKSLILASVLALGLSFPLVSQAEVSAFGVQVPVQTSEVSDNIQGGYVAQSISDTFQVQKLQNTNESKSSDKSYNDTYYVFGVALDGDNAI